MNKEYLRAIVRNPIKHDFLAYGFRLYLFPFGLVVKLSLSGGSLESDWTAEDFPEKTCC